MKTQITVAVAMLVGAALGAVGVGGLNAQGKPGAYAVILIDEVTDADTFKTIIPIAAPAVTGAGGHYLARSDRVTATEGAAPKRIVVIGFDSMDKLNAWHASPGQKQVDAIRLKATKSHQFFFDGM